jgi:hypothetical protein
MGFVPEGESVVGYVKSLFGISYYDEKLITRPEMKFMIYYNKATGEVDVLRSNKSTIAFDDNRGVAWMSTELDDEAKKILARKDTIVLLSMHTHPEVAGEADSDRFRGDAFATLATEIIAGQNIPEHIYETGDDGGIWQLYRDGMTYTVGRLADNGEKMLGTREIVAHIMDDLLQPDKVQIAKIGLRRIIGNNEVGTISKRFDIPESDLTMAALDSNRGDEIAQRALISTHIIMKGAKLDDENKLQLPTADLDSLIIPTLPFFNPLKPGNGITPLTNMVKDLGTKVMDEAVLRPWHAADLARTGVTDIYREMDLASLTRRIAKTMTAETTIVVEMPYLVDADGKANMLFLTTLNDLKEEGANINVKIMAGEEVQNIELAYRIAGLLENIDVDISSGSSYALINHETRVLNTKENKKLVVLSSAKSDVMMDAIKSNREFKRALKDGRAFLRIIGRDPRHYKDRMMTALMLTMSMDDPALYLGLPTEAASLEEQLGLDSVGLRPIRAEVNNVRELISASLAVDRAM